VLIPIYLTTFQFRASPLDGILQIFAGRDSTMSLVDPVQKPKILVSACLLGENTRYDGGHNRIDSSILAIWQVESRILSFCPEVEGGCPIPRPNAEISGGDGDSVIDGTSKVVNENGHDVTREYMLGAEEALRIAQSNAITIALLKARSPSCGSKRIYDGTFSNSLKRGKGVTTALLERNGIRVFNEDQIEEAERYLRKTEP
jgi:uncharacterized protein YbbK (DUF523 family)